MRKLIVVSLVIAGLLAGCAGRELTSVSLVQTLGVDGAGPVTLTAVTGEPEGVYTVTAPTVTQAQEALKGLGDVRLEVTHVAQVVLGPSAAVGDTLWQEVTHRKSGYGATVWLAQGASAQELLSGQENAPARLKSLEENAGVDAPTLMEALSDLTRTGAAELPTLVRREGALAAGERRRVEEGSK